MKDFREELLDICFGVLQPLAKCLLSRGIGYTEFAEICKQAFITVAFSEFGIRGRSTNISRVSAMTGLTRREVRKFKKETLEAKSGIVMRTPPADVLHFWQNDPKFIDESGNPLELPFDGSPKSFSELVRKYAGDRTPGSIRSELIRVHAISESQSGLLSMTKRHFVPKDNDEKLLISMKRSLYALMHTIAHNTSKEEGELGRIERFVSSEFLSKEEIEEFYSYSRARIQKFAEEIDNEFSRLEHSTKKEGISTGKSVGVGIFYYEQNEASSD